MSLAGIVDNKDESLFTCRQAAAMNDYSSNVLTTTSLNRHNSYKETKSTTDLSKLLLLILFYMCSSNQNKYVIFSLLSKSFYDKLLFKYDY